MFMPDTTTFWTPRTIKRAYPIETEIDHLYNKWDRSTNVAGTARDSLLSSK